MTNEEAREVLGDVSAYLASRASLENEMLAGHTFTDICNAIKTLKQQPCEDAISREAVIKIFGEVHPLDYNKQSYIANIQKLPSATPKPRWIPCSERLPERDESVLTYHRNESFDYQYVSWIDDYSGKWAGFIGNLSDEVLAWQPLPEDYKEEDE